MRRRTWRNLGIGAAATVAATAVIGGLASPPGSPVDPPPAAATELERFTGCEELRRWYVEAALPHVTPWGLGGGPAMALPDAELSLDFMAAAPARADGAADQAVANGETGTNVQEAGVDEPDLAKTDGALVAHVDGRQVVLTDTGGEDPRRLSTVRLPRGLDAAELLLVGDRLVVLGTTWQQVWRGPAASDPIDRGLSFPYGGGPAMTRVLVVDVGDPSSPAVEDDTTFDGNLVSARQYGDVVRLVLSTSTPRIDFVQPRRGRTPREARAENRRLVRESSIEDWLPTVGSGGAASPLVECGDVAHPDESSGFGTVSVVGFTPDDPDARRTTAVTTSSDIVYSSAARLYLATSSSGWWDAGRKESSATDVHAFTLDGPETAYVASGEVPGQVRDRWSMSEYDGRLRVATALGRNPWNPTENAVVVLEQQGEALAEVGRVGRMGIRERIQSVRWFDEVAVVVTFRQVDPLYTLDLSDPARPRVVGELKIPGFSSYLHPVGGDLLLGLGQDATPEGRTRGAQASVFDLADLAAPRRVATLPFGRRTEFAAAGDPRAFAYLPERRTVLASLGDWDGGNRVVILHVGEDGSLTRRESLDVPGWNAAAVRTLPLADGRIALVAGRTVRLLRT
jgi:uncharacterized secreted protein with C-terminal beta-propeller domain